jgi:hypothetical protein
VVVRAGEASELSNGAGGRGESRAYVAGDGSEEDEVVYGACCH